MGTASEWSPYYDLVPKTWDKNLAFREEMIRAGASSKTMARELWIMCSRDLLFYINVFGFTFDPRKEPSALPFITWPFQDAALKQINDSINDHDLLIEKSRDMGASWMVMMVYEWRWHFRSGQMFLCASRIEDLVDSTENPDALFWKIDFLHQNQPKWLIPAINRLTLHIGNEDNGSSIDGCATTGDMGRAGRRTSVFMDEFPCVIDDEAALAATADVTKNRIFLGTPKGTANAFYRISTSKTEKLRMHWTLHPEKARGMYVSTDGKPRSPWYDAECIRRNHPQIIAQELDIDYLGSGYQFFNPQVLDRTQAEFTRDPFEVGEIDFQSVSNGGWQETIVVSGFRPCQGGRVKLWMALDARGFPFSDTEYVTGSDISFGTGASNSVSAIGNRKTRELVAEFAVSDMDPSDFARYSVAMAIWARGKNNEGAYMIWEAQGPGRIFGNKVIALGYRNIYYQTNERSLSKKTTDTPGWWPTPENKETVLGEYRDALSKRTFVNRSFDSVNECRQYVVVDGKPVHSEEHNSEDPTGARSQHGDRVIAAALVCKEMARIPIDVTAEQQEALPGSFMFRRVQRMALSRQKAEW